MKKAGAASGKSNLLARTVDEYMDVLSPENKIALESLRRIIKAAAPDAEELISYQIPGYRYRGMLVFFGAFKNHLSLFPASKTVAEAFREELKPFKTTGTTIHFSAANPLPEALVQKIVKYRLAENKARTKNKS
jgi:uncharacterized protein YdhG (YjbR/CyaY superfamily)